MFFKRKPAHDIARPLITAADIGVRACECGCLHFRIALPLQDGMGVHHVAGQIPVEAAIAIANVWLAACHATAAANPLAAVKCEGSA
jgi:hypothetical protein